MNGDDKYRFCAVRVNDLFIMNNEWRELDWVIYTVLTKLMRRQGSIQQSNTQKNIIAGYTGFDRTNQHFDACKSKTGVLNKPEKSRNMIAAPKGYDSKENTQVNTR